MPGRVVAAERLIEDVWDGHPPATAGKALQKYVSELRRLLPADMLRTAGGGYVLEVEADQIDSRRFERRVATGDYAGGLALWRGDLLADLADLSFVAPERARLEELRLFATESRIEAQLGSGHHAAAIGPLTELVDEHPLRERLTSLLMLALYRSGRQVEALRVFQRSRLGDEAPDFTAETTEGTIRFHEWLGDGWGVLFSPSEGLHAGVHHRARRGRPDQARVRPAQRQGDRPQRRPARRTRALGARHRGDPGSRPELPDDRRLRPGGRPTCTG